MKITRLLIALFALAPLARSAESPYDLTLFRGEARVLNEPGVRRMAVGNGRTLNATVLDQRQVLVLAEEEGQSSIHLWHHDGTEVTYSITVASADAGRTLSEVRAMLGGGNNIQARIVGDKVVLEGTDINAEQGRRIAELGKRYPQVVNLISTVGLEQMVAVDVSILEFRKTALRDLGIRWDTRDVSGPTYGVFGDIHRSGPNDPITSALSLSTTITSAINAAVNNGDATFLAEPRLTCKSGASAKFLAGGEIPIPLANGFGNVTVQFKPYGVKLEVSPVVSESGTITTTVFTELSAVDSSLTIGQLPAFITRRTETDVNLRAGETLVISGLFDGSANKTLEKIPGIGDIPVLGELFKSRQYRRNKTELVIFLTPRIVRPGVSGSSAVPDTPEAAGARRDAAQREIENRKKPKP